MGKRIIIVTAILWGLISLLLKSVWLFIGIGLFLLVLVCIIISLIGLQGLEKKKAASLREPRYAICFSLLMISVCTGFIVILPFILHTAWALE